MASARGRGVGKGIGVAVEGKVDSRGQCGALGGTNVAGLPMSHLVVGLLWSAGVCGLVLEEQGCRT